MVWPQPCLKPNIAQALGRGAIIVEGDEHYLLPPKFFQTEMISPVLGGKYSGFSTSYQKASEQSQRFSPNCCSHSGKIKNRIIILSSNSTSGYISKGDEIMVSNWYLHSHVYCSITYNSPDVGTTKCLLDDCMKIWHISWDISQPREKGKLALWDTMDNPWGHYANEIIQIEKDNYCMYPLYVESNIFFKKSPNHKNR